MGRSGSIRSNGANASVRNQVLLFCALLVSAGLMSVAIAEPAYRWLGWVTLLPLFYAIRVCPPLVAVAAGGFWGASLFGIAALASASPVQLDFFSFALLCLIPGAYAGLGSLLTRQVGFSPYLLALGWIGVEFSLHPLGLRYGLLAGTQDGGLALRLVGSFAGYALVAFLVAYVNASLLCVLSEVRVWIPRPRLAASAAALRFCIPSELPSYLSQLFQPSQPRAPPVAA